jgi:hypothetical protein
VAAEAALMRQGAVLQLLAFACVSSIAARAPAADFDGRGYAVFDPAATFTASFEQAEGANIRCQDGCQFALAGGGEGEELALQGSRFVRLDANQTPFELDLELPRSDASYRFRAWVRHARVWARGVFEYTSDRPTEAGWLFPSGRVTSDGWVELQSNPVSVSGSELARAFLRIEGTAVDLDAVEIVPDGAFDSGAACFGGTDPACGDQALCIAERCRQASRYVPPLPLAEHRKSVAEYLMTRVRHFYGGRLSRASYMPAALAEMQKMQAARTAWDYWGAFARGVRFLHDWHTFVNSAMSTLDGPRHLGVCFIEGQADLTQQAWPSAPHRGDILVSHVAPDANLGLKPGDRLVLVDGVPPVDWGRALVGAAWAYHTATDPDVDADFVEDMRTLIARYARNFGVIRCDAATGTCADHVETIDVRDIPSGGSGPRCDNRPAYHLANPPEVEPGEISVNHELPFLPWRERVVDSDASEAIYGMTWDNLYGPALTPLFLEANTFFKQNARGVLLDHRAGNGGTIDAPEAISELVRAPFELSVGPGFMPVAGFDGPATPEEARLLFERFRVFPGLVYDVGSSAADQDLPVALLIHRDGSASDWLPLGLKGAPKVRIFGPHETAGAFSSFYQFGYWSRFDFQIASGDTFTFDGRALIGHGIEPDVIVHHTQSALLEGRDLPYEAALAWLRENLK